MQTVLITAKGLRRLETGHPWVFESDLKRPKGEAQPGVVQAVDAAGETLGYGLYNPRSKIALRLVGRSEPPTDALFVRRVEAAVRYRAGIPPHYSAYRVIHSDADGIPGLTVDRYGDYLVFQQHAAALGPFMPAILEALQKAYKPAGILARNDSSIRALEGLPQEVKVVTGSVPETVAFLEGDIILLASPFGGQKTGAFLDQRENHVFAGERAFGRALDVFSYHGGFALQLARRAESVLAIDASADALEHLTAGAERNGITNLTVQQGDAFALLRELAARGERFDTIVLDPPAFAKGRAQLERAVAGYKEINLQAMRLLSEGGQLLTATCSYHVSDVLFQDTLAAAAADAGGIFRIAAKRAQASCHPERLGMPETHYLKLFTLEQLAWQ